ncbi:hypothetical protein DPMN_130759 [Dreissena polymorpha]|uniref:Ig-like domain-containing protein n=1 Tax=Dreissena polymorpha TaxID=45954 RepID=A0A9D4H872_DREPO|nr:hypothetical protein DPMN_130759 [Dreissena polymorpha]
MVMRAMMILCESARSCGEVVWNNCFEGLDPTFCALLNRLDLTAKQYEKDYDALVIRPRHSNIESTYTLPLDDRRKYYARHNVFCHLLFWKVRELKVSNASVLSLGVAHRNETGNYMCMAKDPVTQDYASSAIIVVDILFTRSYTLNEEQTLRDMTCSAICVFECTYSWKTSYTMITNGHALSISSVRRGDTGIYECAARNPTSGQIVNSQSVEILIRFDVLPPVTQVARSYGESPMSLSTTTVFCHLAPFRKGEDGRFACTATNPELNVTTVVIEIKSM